MLKTLNYSSNCDDEPILRQIDKYLQDFSQEQMAAIALSALFEATEPDGIFLDYEFNYEVKFVELIELILELSFQGKLAVTRALSEELAVLKQLEGPKA